MDAKKLLEKCGVKSKEACEGQGELEYFVEAVEVGRDMARVDSMEGLDVTNSEAKKVVVAKKVVEDEEKVEQYLELQDKGETFRLSSLRVNLAGRSARNLPGQSQKYMWERHATKKVDQQGQIISGVEQVKVKVLWAWTRESVKYLHKFNLYRYMVQDENNMNGKNRVMASKLQAASLGSPRLQHLWVNLSGGSVLKHPGQEEQSLWMKYTTRMVAQGQIISWVQMVLEEYLGSGAEFDQIFVNLLCMYEEYRKYPVQLGTVEAWKVAEVDTNIRAVDMRVRDSKDEQKAERMKDFSPCSAYKLHKKRSGGVPRSIHCFIGGTHGGPHWTSNGR